MELDTQRKSQNSFSNNIHPSSQSRKISIGITEAESGKKIPETRKEVKVIGPAIENKVASSRGKWIEVNKEIGMKAILRGNEEGLPNKETAALFSTQIFHAETSTAKRNEGHENQTSVSVLHKKFDSVSCGRKSGLCGNTKKVEEFTFATAQDVCVLDMGVAGEKTEKISKSSESLRMKLWEILGTAPSPNDQILNLQANVADIEKLSSDLNAETVKPKQNSDTIESDSESPNIRRPVTRSLARRKSQTKTQHKVQNKNNNGVKLHPSSMPCFKLKRQGKNIFTFEEAEGKTGSLHWSADHTSSEFKNKKHDRKARMQPHKIKLPRNMPEETSLQSTERGKTPPLPKRTTEDNHTETRFHSKTTLNGICPLNPKSFSEDEFSQSPVAKKKGIQIDFDSPASPEAAHMQQCSPSPSIPKNTDTLGDFGSPLAPTDAGLLSKFGSSVLCNNTDPQDGFQSPTLAMNTPKENDLRSPPSLHMTDEGKGFHSTEPAERTFRTVGSGILRASQTPKPHSVELSTCSGSSTDNDDSEDPSIRVSIDAELEDEEKRSSLSPKEAEDPGASEGNEFVGKGCKSTDSWFLGSRCSKKPKFMLRSSKRLCSKKGIELTELDSSLPSPKGVENNKLQDKASEQIQENGLASAVAQLALLLEKLKTKMKLQTRQKSSDVLASIADGIHLHLQNIESQIQKDMGKLTSLSKCKRKHLESRFEEHQEHLKVIREKFKQEVNHHLQDCRNTLEEHEAYTIELKGNAERQKTSHRKLLSQAEEAVEVKLDDAEKKIAAIHQAERKNMKVLKDVLGQFLKDGMLS